MTKHNFEALQQKAGSYVWLRQTCCDRGVALAKEHMYLSEKLRVTGSCISITVASSCSLTFVFCLQDSKHTLAPPQREFTAILASVVQAGIPSSERSHQHEDSYFSADVLQCIWQIYHEALMSGQSQRQICAGTFSGQMSTPKFCQKGPKLVIDKRISQSMLHVHSLATHLA